MRTRYIRPLAAFVSLQFFASICLADASQSAFWAERRAAAQRGQGPQVAALAAPPPRIRAVLDQLPRPQAAALSPSIERQVSRAPTADLRDRLERTVRGVPLRAGTVREVTAAADPRARVILHVHDVHLNAEAQGNIEAVVREAVSGGATLVGLEGAFAPIDLSGPRSMPDKPALAAAADFLRDRNRISGPVHAGLTMDQAPAFVGVDDRAAYDANVDAYRRAAPQRASLKEKAAALRGDLSSRKSAGFSPELARFDATVSGYDDGRLPLSTFIAALVRAAGRSPASIETFLAAHELETGLDFRRVEAERGRFLAALVEKLTAAEQDDLIRTSVDYRLGRVGHGPFYASIRALAARHGVALSRFPAMDNYVRYVLLSDGIRPQDLFRDIDALRAEGFARLAATDAERALVAESERLTLAEKLLDFSLTPEEWARYRAGEAALAALGDLSAFEDFYDAAERRNDALTGALLAAMEANGARVAVLVTGGFHAPGVSARLAKAGVSTVSVVPRLTKVDGDGTAYLGVFTQEKTPLDQLFQGPKLFLAPHPGTPAAIQAAGVASLAVALPAGRVAPDVLLGWLRTTYGADARVAGTEGDTTTVRLLDADGAEAFEATVVRRGSDFELTTLTPLMAEPSLTDRLRELVSRLLPRAAEAPAAPAGPVEISRDSPEFAAYLAEFPRRFSGLARLNPQNLFATNRASTYLFRMPSGEILHVTWQLRLTEGALTSETALRAEDRARYDGATRADISRRLAVMMAEANQAHPWRRVPPGILITGDSNYAFEMGTVFGIRASEQNEIRPLLEALRANDADRVRRNEVYMTGEMIHEMVHRERGEDLSFGNPESEVVTQLIQFLANPVDDAILLDQFGRALDNREALLGNPALPANYYETAIETVLLLLGNALLSRFAGEPAVQALRARLASLSFHDRLRAVRDAVQQLDAAALQRLRADAFETFIPYRTDNIRAAVDILGQNGMDAPLPVVAPQGTASIADRAVRALIARAFPAGSFAGRAAYFLYTVFGVLWEAVYNVPGVAVVADAMLARAGVSARAPRSTAILAAATVASAALWSAAAVMTGPAAVALGATGVVAWSLASGYAFAGAHPGAYLTERGWTGRGLYLGALGAVMGAALVGPAAIWGVSGPNLLIGLALYAAIHSGHNFLVLAGILPAPLASVSPAGARILRSGAKTTGIAMGPRTLIRISAANVPDILQIRAADPGQVDENGNPAVALATFGDEPVPLAPGTYYLGRAARDFRVPLFLDSVSRYHLAISVDAGGRVEVIDLLSRLNTRVTVENAVLPWRVMEAAEAFEVPSAEDEDEAPSGPSGPASQSVSMALGDAYSEFLRRVEDGEEANELSRVPAPRRDSEADVRQRLGVIAGIREFDDPDDQRVTRSPTDAERARFEFLRAYLAVLMEKHDESTDAAWRALARAAMAQFLGEAERIVGGETVSREPLADALPILTAGRADFASGAGAQTVEVGLMADIRTVRIPIAGGNLSVAVRTTVGGTPVSFGLDRRTPGGKYRSMDVRDERRRRVEGAVDDAQISLVGASAVNLRYDRATNFVFVDVTRDGEIFRYVFTPSQTGDAVPFNLVKRPVDVAARNLPRLSDAAFESARERAIAALNGADAERVSLQLIVDRQGEIVFVGLPEDIPPEASQGVVAGRLLRTALSVRHQQRDRPFFILAARALPDAVRSALDATLAAANEARIGADGDTARILRAMVKFGGAITANVRFLRSRDFSSLYLRLPVTVEEGYGFTDMLITADGRIVAPSEEAEGRRFRMGLKLQPGLRGPRFAADPATLPDDLRDAVNATLRAANGDTPESEPAPAAPADPVLESNIAALTADRFYREALLRAGTPSGEAAWVDVDVALGDDGQILQAGDGTRFTVGGVGRNLARISVRNSFQSGPFMVLRAGDNLPPRVRAALEAVIDRLNRDRAAEEAARSRSRRADIRAVSGLAEAIARDNAALLIGRDFATAVAGVTQGVGGGALASVPVLIDAQGRIRAVGNGITPELRGFVSGRGGTVISIQFQGEKMRPGRTFGLPARELSGAYRVLLASVALAEEALIDRANADVAARPPVVAAPAPAPASGMRVRFEGRNSDPETPARNIEQSGAMVLPLPVGPAGRAMTATLVIQEGADGQPYLALDRANAEAAARVAGLEAPIPITGNRIVVGRSPLRPGEAARVVTLDEGAVLMSRRQLEIFLDTDGRVIVRDVGRNQVRPRGLPGSALTLSETMVNGLLFFQRIGLLTLLTRLSRVPLLSFLGRPEFAPTLVRLSYAIVAEAARFYRFDNRFADRHIAEGTFSESDRAAVRRGVRAIGLSSIALAVLLPFAALAIDAGPLARAAMALGLSIAGFLAPHLGHLAPNLRPRAAPAPTPETAAARLGETLIAAAQAAARGRSVADIDAVLGALMRYDIGLRFAREGAPATPFGLALDRQLLLDYLRENLGGRLKAGDLSPVEAQVLAEKLSLWLGETLLIGDRDVLAVARTEEDLLNLEKVLAAPRANGTRVRVALDPALAAAADGLRSRGAVVLASNRPLVGDAGLDFGAIQALIDADRTGLKANLANTVFVMSSRISFSTTALPLDSPLREMGYKSLEDVVANLLTPLNVMTLGVVIDAARLIAVQA